ncbi:DUF5667 domain-containing protein [Dictyobacter aurantiacus]|uniref:DUF5667 domain-containing protein n=1 Tax=Dictyobacter aurantiacus TaxID=1936993 RepID=A0A401ZIG6_9CHLR|nr:DUF5667 domain-containing protein [Dictyobacter aurantiacus]GCE06633.1 hypothetical protein KDAU_39620 [Dictyobacter aurantiacus]
MKSLYEHLNHRLDQIVSSSQLSEQHQDSFQQSASDERIDELIVLARRIREAEAVQASSDFARMLERRVLRHHAELKIQQRDKKSSLFSLFRTRFAFRTVTIFCFLFILASTSTLVMAAQVTNPDNPFYVIKHWEQNVQLSLAGNDENQITLNLQFAHERLNTLSSLTSANQASAYRQTLADLGQNISIATSIVDGLPAGTQHDHLARELASFKGNTIHVLRSLLGKLAIPERLATTDELANLGDKVPHIDSAILQLPVHPNDKAIIRFTGNNIDPEAHLLIDGQMVDASGYVQHGNIIFMIDWYGRSYPHSLGIINPDDTTAQTAVISIQNSDTKSNQGDNNGDQSGNKPTVTPSANGNKPTVTPSANGNKPTVTPSANGNKPTATPSANGNKPTATPPARR